jgi:hypothetical protein
MPLNTTKLPASLLALSVLSGSAMADMTQQVEDALNFYHYGKNGAVKIDLNTRYETLIKTEAHPEPQTPTPPAYEPVTLAGILRPARLCRVRRQPRHAR